MPAALRWTFSVVGALTAFGIMALAFPGFHRGPAAEIAEPLWTLWLYHTAEYVPLIRRSDATEVLMAAATFLLAAPVAIWATGKASPRTRWVWGMLIGSLVWFQALGTFQQVRWTTYVHLLGALPFAWLLGRVIDASSRVRLPLLAAATRIFAVIGVALAPVALAATIGLSTGRTDYQVLDACEPGQVITALERLRGPSGDPATILAPIFWGPEILFRTQHNVVATPYHRNPGILASHEIMSAPPGEARARIVERGITHIAWCPDLAWLPFVDSGESPTTLYGHLASGNTPDWLSALTQPTSRVRISEVR